MEDFSHYFCSIEDFFPPDLSLSLFKRRFIENGFSFFLFFFSISRLAFEATILFFPFKSRTFMTLKKGRGGLMTKSLPEFSAQKKNRPHIMPDLSIVDFR